MSQIETFIEAGIPPSAILSAMTTNAANLLGVEKNRGAIKVGLVADIIATPENPLENISNSTRIEAVAIGGRWLDRRELDQMLASAQSKINER